MACDIDSQLSGFINQNDCNKSRGLIASYLIHKNDIDKDATAADPLLWDSVLNCFKGFALKAGAMFVPFIASRKGTGYRGELTEDTGYYNYAFTANFQNGKTPEFRNAVCALQKKCDLVAVVFDANCGGRVLGLDFESGALIDPVEGLRLTNDIDDSGQYDGDVVSDVLTLTAKHSCRALHTCGLTLADFKAAYPILV